MTQTILNGVSRKMQLAFINGAISENVLIKQYERKSILLERIQLLETSTINTLRKSL